MGDWWLGQMNRRDFIKRLGKVAALPVVASLIKLPTVDDQDAPVDLEEGYADVKSLARWNGSTWSAIDGELYISGEFVRAGKKFSGLDKMITTGLD